MPHRRDRSELIAAGSAAPARRGSSAAVAAARRRRSAASTSFAKLTVHAPPSASGVPPFVTPRCGGARVRRRSSSSPRLRSASTLGALRAAADPRARSARRSSGRRGLVGSRSCTRRDGDDAATDNKPSRATTASGASPILPRIWSLRWPAEARGRAAHNWLDLCRSAAIFEVTSLGERAILSIMRDPLSRSRSSGSSRSVSSWAPAPRSRPTSAECSPTRR